MTPSLRLARAFCLAASCALMLPPSAFAADSKPKKTPKPTATPGSMPGQAPASGPVLNVRIDVLMVAMPEEKFITLLPDLLDKDKIEKAVPDLLEAVKRKEMILEGYPVVITKSGQRAVVETVKEVRYPTEELAPDTSQSAPDSSQSGSASPSPSPAAPAASPSPTPTPEDVISFETRNIGTTLEVEAVILPDGQTIDLNLAPQHVQLLGFENTPEPGKTEGEITEHPSKTNASRPLFYTMKVTTSITLHNGQHMLIAVHKAAQPEGDIEAFIVHAETMPVDK